MNFFAKPIKIFLLLLCITYSGCQPKGGSLAPILQEGTKITSFHKQRDVALQYDTETFSLKVLGGWEPLYGNVGFTLVIINRSLTEVSIDLSKISLGNSLNEKIKVLAVQDFQVESSSKSIESKIAEVGVNETKVLGISVGEGSGTYKDGVKYQGNIIWMTIPIIEQSKHSATINYNFKFKYDDYQPESSNDEGIIN